MYLFIRLIGFCRVIIIAVAKHFRFCCCVFVGVVGCADLFSHLVLSIKTSDFFRVLVISLERCVVCVLLFLCGGLFGLCVAAGT